MNYVHSLCVSLLSSVVCVFKRQLDYVGVMPPTDLFGFTVAVINACGGISMYRYSVQLQYIVTNLKVDCSVPRL